MLAFLYHKHFIITIVNCMSIIKVSQSIAASGLPPKVWAVVDLYGKCAAVTLTDPNSDQEARILSNALTNEATAAASASFHQAVNQISAHSNNEQQHNRTNTTIAALTLTTEASHTKPSCYQRETSATKHGGNNVEHSPVEGQSERTSQSLRPAEATQLDFSVDRGREPAIQNQALSSLGKIHCLI